MFLFLPDAVTTNNSSLQDTPSKRKKSAIPDFQIFRTAENERQS
jgi:hypothetical protein